MKIGADADVGSNCKNGLRTRRNAWWVRDFVVLHLFSLSKGRLGGDLIAVEGPLQEEQIRE